MQLIADGDSSVYAMFREGEPGWGKHVTKMEFLNESNRSEAINLLAHDIKNCSHFCTANEKRNETFSRDNFNANDIQTSLKVKAISNFGQKAYLY